MRPLLRHARWRLLVSMTRQAIASRYRQSGLQLLWAVVGPAAMIGVYAVFFRGILRIGSGTMPYLSFILTGLVPWRFVAGSLASVTTFVDARELISKTYFPRELLPLSRVAAGLPELVVGLAITVITCVVQNGLPGPEILLVVPAVWILGVTAAWATVVVSTVAVFIRDVVHGVPFVIQTGFFVSPVMYESARLPSWLSWLNEVNPVAVVIDALRAGLLGAPSPALWLIAVHSVAAGLLLYGSFAYVRSVEHRMTDIA